MIERMLAALESIAASLVMIVKLWSGAVVPPPPVDPKPMPALLWDGCLNVLKLSVERVDGARYRIIAAWLTENGSWENVPDWARRWQRDTLGGDHHAFGCCLDKAGSPIGKTFLLSWPTGQADRTPEADGWANLPLAGQNWDPANGPGPYLWEALKGDRLRGLGMPLNHHVSFFAVWQEV